MTRAILLLALISAPAGAQTLSDSGLETANYKYVAVVVRDLDAAARGVGLTEDRIRTRVELRLRSAGLTPGDDTKKNKTYLDVTVTVAGQAFVVLVAYKRLVSFITGNQQYKFNGTTWNDGGTGTHGDSAAFIMNGLDQFLDKFLNEYLKANQK